MAYTSSITSKSSTFQIDNSHTHFIMAGTSVINATGYGIEEGSYFHENTIEINGKITVTDSVAPLDAGLMLHGYETSLLIGESGEITADFGVVMAATESSVINHGTITGKSYGLVTTLKQAVIENTGTISGDVAIEIQNDASSLTNSGMIEGLIRSVTNDDVVIALSNTSIVIDLGNTIEITGSKGENSKVTNAGSITSGQYAYLATESDDTLVNKGSITGTIDFGAGKDLFDNRGGKLDSKSFIYGGADNDTFIVDGKIRLIENTGQGTDTLKSGNAINLFADYTGQSIENLVLLGSKSVNGMANSLDNKVYGNTGNNILSGMKGLDRLVGGKGTDTLTGGADADTFVFKTGYGKDTVTDFQNGSDHFDLKSWSAITDFADLKAHHLTVSGNDLIISHGTDKLIILDTAKGELDASDFLF